MDPALKKRLLGAAVLLALLVIFVPMLFPGPQEEEPPVPVELDIPAEPGEPLDSRVFTLDLPDRAPADATEEAPTADDDSAPVPVPDAPVETATPEAPPPDAATEPAAARAPAPAGTAANVRFAVSVGVFGQRANADARLAAVKLLGYPAQLLRVRLGERDGWGVRVGPFDGRASAEAARLRLRDELEDAAPSLVALSDAADADVSTAAVADRAAGWAVQLAAFRQRADADALSARARQAGFEAFVDQTQDAGGIWWRVRVGPRTDRDAAVALRESIKSKLGTDGLVVAHP